MPLVVDKPGGRKNILGFRASPVSFGSCSFSPFLFHQEITVTAGASVYRDLVPGSVAECAYLYVCVYFFPHIFPPPVSPFP